MRIFCAGLFQETNSFSPIPTTLDDFGVDIVRDDCGQAYARPRHDISDEVMIPPIARARGHEVITGLAVAAEPGAPCADQDFKLLCDTLYRDLERAGKVDAVALFLHGAMTSDGCLDCEGELIKGVRARVGPEVPIAVLLDLHVNVSQQMLDQATFLWCCREYPHTDFSEAAAQLFDCLERTLEGRMMPVMHFERVPMLGSYPTGPKPMREFLEALSQRESEAGVEAILLCHGFPWVDSPDTGAGVLVIADETLGDVAAELAVEVADQFLALRELISMTAVPVDEALDQASRCEQLPVILADCADNPGGGAPGDSTVILTRLSERGTRRVALGMICDPEAVQLAAAAGQGACVSMSLGGRYPPYSGKPLLVRAQILCLRDDVVQPSLPDFPAEALGAAALVDIDGILLVLNSRRQQVISPVCFTAFGIELNKLDLIVVKSSQHFRAAFDAISQRVIYVQSPGVQTFDYASLPYRNIKHPLQPLDR